MFINENTMKEVVKDFPFVKKLMAEVKLDMIYIKTPSYRNLYEDKLEGRVFVASKRGALNEYEVEDCTCFDVIEKTTRAVVTVTKRGDRTVANVYLIYNAAYYMELAA